MSCSFGSKFKITVFGQSHSDCIGVVIDGVPAGLHPDLDAISAFLRRRAPGKGAHTTARKETDAPQILSGIVDGVTCGAPLCAVIQNENRRSGDYDALKNLPRPGHADFTAFEKFDGYADTRGGGNFSGRMTAPLCFAGAIAKQILAESGITIGAHISRLAKIDDAPFDPIGIDAKTLKQIAEKDFPVLRDDVKDAMLAAIAAAKEDGDSVGGVIECAAVGLPVGWGEPIFDGAESIISHLVFGIPAVKGIEFGSGFAGADLRGSENNDAFTVKNGEITTKTNCHGGILGGITSGQPLIFRAAIKPTPSIAKAQTTVHLQTLQEETITIGGRHDPCIVPRAVPCMEAAMAIALLNLD
ncbi:MAG: chorismate synthase [Clostridia bacterium]|nr:chorismate synthase [Clostridia bacterium]